jgi:hypothetical protein
MLAILGADFDQFIALPSIGDSGGVLSWKRHVKVTCLSRVDAYSVSVQFQKSNGQPWWLTCVYGPQSNDEKISFFYKS